MRRVSLRTLRAALLTAGLLAAAASAKDGRDFAGYFSLSDWQENDGQVAVTLVLRIFNYSGEGLENAVLTLRPRFSAAPVDFAPIKQWPDRSDVTVSQRVTVSREEAQLWLHRLHPGIYVKYTSAGALRLSPVQLGRQPSLPVPPVKP